MGMGRSNREVKGVGPPLGVRGRQARGKETHTQQKTASAGHAGDKARRPNSQWQLCRRQGIAAEKTAMGEQKAENNNNTV